MGDGSARGSSAVAALDLGTSRIRLGILASAPARLEIIGDTANHVDHAVGGSARCRFSSYWAAVEDHLQALGRWCQSQGIAEVRLAITGQVSSLIPWMPGAAAPVEDTFAIWMDTTCLSSVPALAGIWDGEGARTLLGSCMPASTNWLAVKIHHHLRGEGARGVPSEGSRGNSCQFLQLQDGILRRLTGMTLTHPSAQISLVDHRRLTYAPAMLRFLSLESTRLPTIDAAGQAALLPDLAVRYGLPRVTVHVAPQDTHAALFGFYAHDGDGLLLAGTSEIVGVYEEATREREPLRMVRARLGSGWIVYGSSASGGASVDWLMRSVLRRNTPEELERLTIQAEAVAPGCEGLLCLPYFSGERAPLWNNALAGSLIGLRAHHTDAHLLRAVLEGVAMARRQAAEALERDLPSRFLAAGGGTASALWNRIRASVFDRPLVIMSTADLALIGAMRGALAAAGKDDTELRRLLASRPPSTVAPVPAWVATYRQSYARFLQAQHSLTQTAPSTLVEVSHA